MAVPPVGAAPPVAAPAPVAPRGPGFSASLAAQLAPRAAPASAPAPHAALAPLARVEAASARLDAVLAAAKAGRTFTAAELIGLQAEAYRCAQTVDLASRLVEQGAQSVKQAVNTQL